VCCKYFLLFVEYICHLFVEIEELLFLVVFHGFFHDAYIIPSFTAIVPDQLRLYILLYLFFIFLFLFFFGEIFLCIFRHTLIYSIFLAERTITLLQLWLRLLHFFWYWCNKLIVALNSSKSQNLLRFTNRYLWLLLLCLRRLGWLWFMIIFFDIICRIYFLNWLVEAFTSTFDLLNFTEFLACPVLEPICIS
jgi:hypothetical protein